ncbi:permease for cytosine/purines, uracil, thiamine, allantoin-domain-containing protein [Gongronella butleri]|nr:permease for cytosine/purines, uracil, thiamine, allantoin-domain-containing protein [Gongronella butleri]
MQLDERPRDEKVEKDDDASFTQDDSEPAIEKAPDQILAGRNTFLGTMYSRLFRLGVESRGVERVLEEDRSPKNAINSILLWFSVNTVLTTIPIGALAQEVFSLTLPHAIAVIFTFTALGCATTAFIATLGPKTGCRTMVVTRFSFGYVGGVILSIFNILTQMGFSVICVVLGGQTLASINNTLPLPAGIVIIAVCSLVICFFGYDLLHHYERYAYIVITVIVIMLYVLGSQWPAGYDLTAQSASEATGTDLAADVLSFGAVMFGSSAGWAPVAADFNMRLPESTSSIRVFWLTFIGLYVPIVFVSILGACLVTIQNPVYQAAYSDSNNGGMGALIGQVFAPWSGGGKFLMVVLSLSVIANNVPNTYSAALSIQALGKPFQRIPRFLWTVLVAILYTVAGIAGRESFSAILSNLLSILSYWVAFFAVIVAEEHFIFRRNDGYNLDDYATPSKLPKGYAAIFAGCCGVAGAVVGMAQVYYTGPIAKLIGDEFGADLGFELAAGFAAITYPPLRYLEKKHYGR